MPINQFIPGGQDPSYLSMNNTLVYYEPESCKGKKINSLMLNLQVTVRYT